MKKTYITPALHVEHIQAELPIAVSQTTMSKNSSNKIENSGDILTKDRGDYMPEDNATYGDLW